LAKGREGGASDRERPQWTLLQLEAEAWETRGLEAGDSEALVDFCARQASVIATWHGRQSKR
jgi:hypothetical protein